MSMKEQHVNFKTYHLSEGPYNCFVICMSYKSIFDLFDQICIELKSKGIATAEVLFDQLFITGNKNNRFLSITYNNGLLLHSTAVNVLPTEKKYRQLTSYEFRKNVTLLDASALSETQKAMIKKGFVI